MSFFSSLRDKYLIQPVANRIITSLQTPEVAKAAQPNIWDVPFGFNSSMGVNNKRQTRGSVDFEMLRSLSIHHETTRAAINTRKRQITQLGFEVVDIDEETDPQGTLEQREQVRQLVIGLGGPGVRFRELLDKLMEDTLVLDACVFYKQRTRGGQLLRIIPIDGATIKLVVDQSGARPFPPKTAFEQWLGGKKVAEMNTNELSYELMNPRTDSPYGLSPLESLIITLDTSMKAMLYNAHYLSDNNVPQGFLQMPEGWTIQQIKEYKEFFDAMVSGTKGTSKMYPVPSSTTYQATSKPTDFSFQEFLDYLDRKVCMMFDVQPQEIGLALKQYKENAEGQEKIQIRRGIKPLANFLQEIFTDIIRDEFGFTQFQFKFVGIDGRYSVEDIKALTPIGVLGVDEARNDRGLAKIGVGNIVIAGQTIIPIDSLTTISGMQSDQDEQEEMADDDPTNEKLAKRLQKVARNEGFEAVEKQQNFKMFQRRMQQALKNQVTPFTHENTVARVADSEKMEKAVNESVDELTPSISVFFDNEAINEFLKWVATQGGQRTYKSLNLTSSFDLTSEDFKRMLGDRANYLIDSVDSTTKDWIINQIQDGKDLSYTNADIAATIADQVDDFTYNRAKMIVDTEVANALGAAQVDIYKDQGFEEKQWVTSEDEQVCPICEPMDGEVVKIDDEFSAGVDHEPAHPRCRCYTQAVLDQV